MDNGGLTFIENIWRCSVGVKRLIGKGRIITEKIKRFDILAVTILMSIKWSIDDIYH